jgi:uncharacterized protein (DUF1501 family)
MTYVPVILQLARDMSFHQSTAPENGRLPHPRLTRRTLLQAGAIGLLGLGLPELNALRGAAARRAPAAVYVFLSGGLSQLDSFDPKPDAPSEIRGEFRPLATRTQGVQICEHLPLLAARSERFALVRSLTHKTNDHSAGHHMMLTGRGDLPPGFDPEKPKASDWPSIASLATYAAAPSGSSLPAAVVLPQWLVHRTGRVIPGQGAGLLGSRWDPFLLDAASRCEGYGPCPSCFHFERGGIQHTAQPVFQPPCLTLPQGLDLGRVGGRAGLLARIEEQRRGFERAGETLPLDRYRAEALALLSDPETRRAFDVHETEPRTLDRYGRNQFGWSLLLARRLVERGVSLVQVNLGNDETWDTHQGAFPILRDFLLPAFDRAFSALLDDLEAAGLLETTLVVVGSEFGRTPKISKLPGAALAGRDHWGAVQSVLLAGGGVKGGRVIGASDRLGGVPARDPQTPESFAATIFRALGIPRDASWIDATGRPMPFYGAHPIPGLT